MPKGCLDTDSVARLPISAPADPLKQTNDLKHDEPTAGKWHGKSSPPSVTGNPSKIGLRLESVRECADAIKCCPVLGTIHPSRSAFQLLCIHCRILIRSSPNLNMAFRRLWNPRETLSLYDLESCHAITETGRRCSRPVRFSGFSRHIIDNDLSTRELTLHEVTAVLDVQVGYTICDDFDHRIQAYGIVAHWQQSIAAMYPDSHVDAPYTPLLDPRIRVRTPLSHGTDIGAGYSPDISDKAEDEDEGEDEDEDEEEPRRRGIAEGFLEALDVVVMGLTILLVERLKRIPLPSLSSRIAIQLYKDSRGLPSRLKQSPTLRIHRLVCDATEREPQPVQGPRRRPIVAECPICLDTIGQDRRAVTRCESCGQAVHQECFDRWSAESVANRRVVRCVMCRSNW
jgi:hypothetical protein